MASSQGFSLLLLSLLSFALTVSAIPPWPASTPMPCAMLSPYTTVRDASMMASCCAILQRQAVRLGAMSAQIPAPCYSPFALPEASPDDLLSEATPDGMLSEASPDGLLSECASCEEDSDCSLGTCWGEPKMCTDFSLPSLKRCFKKECIKCKMDDQCSTKRCWLGRCAWETNLSQVRCFPVHLLDLITGR